MKGRTPTAAERRHMAMARELGCIACRNMGITTPSEYTLIHHIDGKTKPDAHRRVLPLCFNHHDRGAADGIHANPTEWEARHGTQEQLLEQVRGLLGEA
jgi:hypothetical protein